MASYFDPNAFNDEGVDHINISGQSQTHLGKLLDPSYLKVIHYPHIGKFNSVLNLWYWLKTDNLDDQLRNLTGVKLKNRIINTTGQKKVHNFKSIIGHATYIKLKEYPHIIRDLKNLPESVQFISYYTPKGSAVRMCSKYAPIIVEIINVIKKAVDQDKEPDFKSLNTCKSSEGFYYLEPFLLDKLGLDKFSRIEVPIC